MAQGFCLGGCLLTELMDLAAYGQVAVKDRKYDVPCRENYHELQCESHIYSSLRIAKDRK
jgi:hypothetical protein